MRGTALNSELSLIRNIDKRVEIWYDYARKINIPSYWLGAGC